MSSPPPLAENYDRLVMVIGLIKQFLLSIDAPPLTSEEEITQFAIKLIKEIYSTFQK